MTRSKAWKKVGLGVGLCAAIAAAAFQAVRAAPEPSKPMPPPKSAAAKPFAAICKAGEVVDSRPQPAWVGASFARDNCWAPPMPAPLDGAKATREQVVARMAAVKNYAARSDVYQKCISDFVASHKVQADKANKPANWPLIVIETHRIFVSQENKKTAANQMKVAINAFNAFGSDCPE